ncbi:uncharacterized protein LOC121740420 [Aricia agestis]|uniref:uncharacterized protein LOC121740420 n=1 Tax=Aricia agestis TaxID=91739 RepID=UPI001C202AEB|nr:uncharacterized protein LOC121740420 [Aricia agestis]
MDMMTVTEDEEKGSRASTPASNRSSRFFYNEPGRGESPQREEDGNSTTEVTPMPKTQRRKFLRKRPGTLSDEDSVNESGLTTSKRGRGRPPNTGASAGQYKAKKVGLADERELQAPTATKSGNLDSTGKFLIPCNLRLSEYSTTSDWNLNDKDDNMTMSALDATITSNLDAIVEVAKKSKSASIVTILKESTTAIQQACAVLLNRSKTDEIRALEADNARLSKEISELRNDLMAIKRELSYARLQTAQPHTTIATSELNVVDFMQQAVQEAVKLSSARLDARLEGLEARLLPAPSIRPPLAADKKKDRTAPATIPAEPSQSRNKRGPELETRCPVVTTLMPPTNPGLTQNKRRKKTRQSAAAAEAANTRRSVAEVTTAPRQSTEEWSRSKEEARKVKAPKKRKKRKLRSPKTSAVVLTLQPEAEKRGITYLSVLEEAKKRVDLVALDIPGVRYREAVTGARIYEVSGNANKDKADALAGKLREVLGEENVRISRPQKCVELRITGLDDSATPTEIAEAVARSGACLVSNIKIGKIRRDRNGRGSVWLKCPVDAAKKITAPNTRVCVGWTVVRVTLLSARPMRCYRCQETGHARSRCGCEVDRTGLCYRCAQPGHVSASCQNALHCALCESKGKPADHRVGSSICGKGAPKKKDSTKRKPAETAAVSSVAEKEAEMET